MSKGERLLGGAADFCRTIMIAWYGDAGEGYNVQFMSVTFARSFFVCGERDLLCGC